MLHVGTPLQIRDMPDDAIEVLRRRAAQRRLSLAAYAREILLREAGRATMHETLSGPRLVTGPPLSASYIRRLIRDGRR